MTKNTSGLDRVLRVVAGGGLVAAAALGLIGWWGYLGVVLALTALIGFCPAYRILGLSTCPVRGRSA